jgi:O-antigen ligase
MNRLEPNRVVVAAYLLLSTGAILPLFGAAPVDPSGYSQDSGGNASSQIVWFLVYGALALALALSRRERRAPLFGHAPLLAAVVLAALSTFWSSAPDLTARRALALALTVGAGVYIGSLYDLEELFEIVAWVLATAIALSAVVVLVGHGRGLDPLHPGAWRGAFATKNELGRLATFGSIVWILRAAARRRGVLLSLGIASLGVLCVYRSGSKTSEVVLALLLVLLVAYPALRSEPMRAAAAAMFLLCVTLIAVYWLVFHGDRVLNLIGSDSSLTGRTQIWHAVWPMIRAKPLWGYGFAAFWIVGGPAVSVWDRLGATPPHAHDGWLELWLELGIVGVALFAWWLGRGFLAAWSVMGRYVSPLGVWPLLVVAMLLVSNVTESDFLARNSIFTVVSVAVVGQALAVRRRRPAASPRTTYHAPVRPEVA